MGNGTWQSIQLTNLTGSATRPFYAVDYEYNKVYIRYQSSTVFEMIDLVTGVLTTLTSTPSFGGYESHTIMATSVINGKVYIFHDESGYADYTYTISDRNTGAGSWGTKGGTQIPDNYDFGNHAIYNQSNNSIYFYGKVNVGSTWIISRLNLTTDAYTHISSGITSTSEQDTMCMCGDKIVTTTTSNFNQLVVWNTYNNTSTTLSNYYLAIEGVSLDMRTISIFSVGNTVNFYSKGKKFTYDFNALEWSHTTEDAGYGSVNTLLNSSNVFVNGSTYLIGGTYTGSSGVKLIKHSYFLQQPTNIRAAIVNGKVQFTWTDNADDENFYIIERKRSDESSYTKVSVDYAIIGTGTGSTITWIDETADINLYTYSYNIKARLIQI